jgi:precorrin-4/cobalt-precorrin-4 C11-methyltransferase
MKVYFVGAGPGDPELLTIKAERLLKNCTLCVYAGSLVSPAVIALIPAGARKYDSAHMSLPEITAVFREAKQEDRDVLRLHSGDPSLYGAIAEQMARLDALAIPYDITPGVSAYAAAAAALKCELTLPQQSQTVILTRTAVRASAMPPGEELAKLGATGAMLAIHLSINNLARVVRDLVPHYGEDCPCIVAYRVSWPDELMIRATLGTIRAAVKDSGITRTALILVGRGLGSHGDAASRLYAADHDHVLRPKR